MEMIYIYLNEDLSRINEAFKTDVSTFLFVVQYLIRKRKIENDEQQRLINSKRGGL